MRALLGVILMTTVFSIFVAFGCYESSGGNDEDDEAIDDDYVMDDDVGIDDDTSGQAPIIQTVKGNSIAQPDLVANGILILGQNLTNSRVFVYPLNHPEIERELPVIASNSTDSQIEALLVSDGWDIEQWFDAGYEDIRIVVENQYGLTANDEAHLLQGETGPEGPQGATGPEGPQGPAGPEGSQGAIGPEGPQGATGPEGPQGPAGPEGSQGATGPEGPQGPAGPEGSQGATGPEGPQGPAGPEGSQGAIGPEGPQGATGAEGPQGPQGPFGIVGTKSICTSELVSWEGLEDWQTIRSFSVDAPEDGFFFVVGTGNAIIEFNNSNPSCTFDLRINDLFNSICIQNSAIGATNVYTAPGSSTQMRFGFGLNGLVGANQGQHEYYLQYRHNSGCIPNQPVFRGDLSVLFVHQQLD